MKIIIASFTSTLLFTAVFAVVNYAIEGAAVASRYWSEPYNLILALLVSGAWTLIMVLPAALLSAFTKLNTKSWSWACVSASSFVMAAIIFVTSYANATEKLLVSASVWGAGICTGAIFMFLGILPLTRRSSGTALDARCFRLLGEK